MNGKLTVTEKDGLVDWSDIVITVDGQSLTVEQLATAWKKAHDQLARTKRALQIANAALREIAANDDPDAHWSFEIAGTALAAIRKELESE